MPAVSALSIGLMNAVASTTVVAMPSTFGAMAESRAVSMVRWVDCVEVAPVHEGLGIPSRAAQSWNPYWVGVKNELSVTWLTKVNLYFGVAGKFPAASLAALAVLPLELELQAGSRAGAA